VRGRARKWQLPDGCEARCSVPQEANFKRREGQNKKRKKLRKQGQADVAQWGVVARHLKCTSLSSLSEV